MAAPSTPANMLVQSANRQILISWDMSAGADSYIVKRSLDNITFSTLATVSGSPLATSYLDTTPVISTKYYYKVAAANGVDVSAYTMAQSAVAVPVGEKCLAQIRLEAQQAADRVNSQFVSTPEWNTFINTAMFELYDLLVTLYEDLYVAEPAGFTATGSTSIYALPDGATTFTNSSNANFTPKAFYKLLGVDLAVNSTQNAWVTVNKFNFIDRNKFLYPATNSTIYGVYNMRYRLMGSNIEFIPNPSAGQRFRLWYIPRLQELLQDTDTTDTGISGWIRYVVVRAAKYALDKEESDTSKLDQELLFLKARIEESASNRDAGQADTISNTRMGSLTSGWGPFGGGSGAGW